MVAQTVGIGTPATLRFGAVRDSALLNAVVNARLLAERDLESETGLRIRVLQIAGESSSAQSDGTDEVVHWLYVGVSEIGEIREQRAYRLGPLFNPRVER